MAFLAYLALLLPWRLAQPAYAHLLAPPVRLLATLVDGAVTVAADGPRLRYTRIFDEARTAAGADRAAAPPVFAWMSALFGKLHRDMYPYRLPDGSAARPTPMTQTADIYRLTLELPLFLALVLALPGVPWRRRLRPTIIGLSILLALHIFLAATPAFALTAAAGDLRSGAQGFESTAGGVWVTVADRYQYVGPVAAFALFLSLLFLGAFEPRRPRAAPPSAPPAPRSAPAPPSPAPPAPPASQAPPAPPASPARGA